MASAIKLENIDKYYGEKVRTQVLFDINLDIKEGSFVSIIGQSGSGKSTLLNIIGTLDKSTSGNVIIDNENTNQLKQKQLSKLRNETIGFVFQFHYLLPEYNVFENILMPAKIKGKITKEDKKRADMLLDYVDLTDKKNYMINMLSGGQQQRVSIARSLMNNPKIVLADEPTGNLDSKGTEKIYELLRNINKEFNTTFVVITHDRKVAEKADRVIEIKDGRVELDIVNGVE